MIDQASKLFSFLKLKVIAFGPYVTHVPNKFDTVIGLNFRLLEAFFILLLFSE